MPKSFVAHGVEWSSEGIGRQEAVDSWRKYFAERQETPVEISVFESDGFPARLVSRGVGQLRLLHLRAPAQKVVHRAIEQELAAADHLIHLIYSIRGTFHGRAEGLSFTVEPGEFVLIDNSRLFEFDMFTPHEAIDLIVPRPWLERFVPDPLAHVGRPVPMDRGWAPPLASMLLTIAHEGEDCPLPRPLVAEQLGNLVALAIGTRETVASRPGARLAQQVMRRIESDFSDPDLSPARVAADLQISKRYLQALLANSGTSFSRELNAARLDRANILLTDPRTRALAVAEVAFRCGFLDPGYFARQFRKRFNATPRAWRAMN
ncbi:MAG: AraC family transcriptional regulator [Proteobacteria bacterium]|nr:AraC family transcriptional regulator [Pseudomonadota bacterium]